MSILFKIIERQKPKSDKSWLKTEQQEDFESTYFSDEGSAFEVILMLVEENGLLNEFQELDELPIDIEQFDFNPMIEAVENWNEFKANGYK